MFLHSYNFANDFIPPHLNGWQGDRWVGRQMTDSYMDDDGDEDSRQIDRQIDRQVDRDDR